MTHSFQPNSTHTDVIGSLRKGGLQVLRWHTYNVFNIECKDKTHPYVVNHFNCVTNGFVYKGGE
jgi:hypothetical protein